MLRTIYYWPLIGLVCLQNFVLPDRRGLAAGATTSLDRDYGRDSLPGSSSAASVINWC